MSSAVSAQGWESALPRDLDFTGESGTVYRYQVHQDDRTASPAGGNFLYVKMEDATIFVIFAGETESLYKGLREQWSVAREQHGANAILMRLNVTGDVRRAEQADLVAKYRPVMNADNV
jgi:hypothetical protein